jgi:hypothetical protein
MRRAVVLLFIGVVSMSVAVAAQGDKELVATITGPMLKGGMVSELAWDGSVLIIQTVTMDASGVMKAGYFTSPGRGMDVMASPEAPPELARYWKLKSSRVSPTGLGRITDTRDAKMPMYGIASQAQRFADAHEMGGTLQTHALVLHDSHDSFADVGRAAVRRGGVVLVACRVEPYCLRGREG